MDVVSVPKLAAAPPSFYDALLTETYKLEDDELCAVIFF